MALLRAEIAALHITIPSVMFGVVLAIHILAGVTCVAIAAKRPGSHPLFGRIYYWSFLVAFAALTVLSLMRWARDWPLFVIGAIAFTAATVGYIARTRWRAGWIRLHISGMGLSYMALLTGFYVDNGPHLPFWSSLPHIAYWTFPSIVGVPLILRALVVKGQLTRVR